jgi:hypothetical protein
MMSGNKCTHNKRVTVDKSYYDDDGELVVDFEEEVEQTFVDIDLHRYKCTQCGEIGYYSGAARQYYEQGITTNIRGLDDAMHGTK